MVDVSSGRKVRKQFLPALNGSEKNFFNTTLEDVYRAKYGGRMPLLTENVASGIGTGLKAIGVPKYRAEDVGRRVTKLAEDWTPLGALPAVEKGGLLGTGLGVLAAVPIVGGKAGKVAKAVEEILPEPGGLLAGIRGYHGSPHSFAPEPGAPLGRFRDTAIGTGEGAQAYGRGHYLAENPAVGRDYRESTMAAKDMPRDMRIGSQEIHQVYNNLSRVADRLSPQAARGHYDKMALLEDLMNEGDVLAVRQRILEGAYSPEVGAWFEKNIAPKFNRKGALYEVNIAADPEHFLDWDKPLSEQHPVVQEQLRGIGSAQKNRQLAETDVGRELYFKQSQGLSNESASERLKQAGIPGIRYLDQGSRISDEAAAIVKNYGSREKAMEIAEMRLKNASMGDIGYWQRIVDSLKTPESRNYVVFSPEIIKIVRKYGLTAAIASGVISEEMGRQMQEQGEI